MTFWKKKNYGDNQKISGCKRWDGGEINRKNTEDFLGQYDPITVHMCYYTFVQAHRMYTTKSKT